MTLGHLLPTAAAGKGIGVSLAAHAAGLALLGFVALAGPQIPMQLAGSRHVVQLEVSLLDPQPSSEARPEQFEMPVMVMPERARIAERLYVRIPSTLERPQLRLPPDESALDPVAAEIHPSRATAAVDLPPTVAEASPRAEMLATLAPLQVAVPHRAATPQPLGTEETPPDFSRNTPPVYPEEARRRGLSGTVLLELHVDAQGYVAAVDVVRSSGHAVLDGAAVSAVRGWRGSPRLEGGRPVASIETLPIEFRLR